MILISKKKRTRQIPMYNCILFRHMCLRYLGRTGSRHLFFHFKFMRDLSQRVCCFATLCPTWRFAAGCLNVSYRYLAEGRELTEGERQNIQYLPHEDDCILLQNSIQMLSSDVTFLSSDNIRGCNWLNRHKPFYINSIYERKSAFNCSLI